MKSLRRGIVLPIVPVVLLTAVGSIISLLYTNRASINYTGVTFEFRSPATVVYTYPDSGSMLGGTNVSVHGTGFGLIADAGSTLRDLSPSSRQPTEFSRSLHWQLPHRRFLSLSMPHPSQPLQYLQYHQRYAVALLPVRKAVHSQAARQVGPSCTM